jgi:deoxyribodipyrimidine photolyase-related protein
MSDCCETCSYDRRKTTGDDACPFNSLYWDFLARNRKQFRKNARMNMVMALLSKKKPADLRALRGRADNIRSQIADGGTI